MDEQLLGRLNEQERELREVAELLSRAILRVHALRDGDGWRGSAADAYRAAIDTLQQQLAGASTQLAEAVMSTMVLSRGWGPHG